MAQPKDETHSFYGLCTNYRDYRGDAPHEDILLPWLDHAEHSLAAIQHFRSRNSPDTPYAVEAVDLYRLYALNRCNDYLLASLPTWHGSPVANHQSDEWRDSMAGGEAQALVEGKVTAITLQQYGDFFVAMGFETFGALPYHPFHHEIVEVIQDSGGIDVPIVEHIFWPGLRFGEMLFSRAGVRVRCPPAVLEKQIAERSSLYFTYWRQTRNTQDISHGWGSNSQWGTEVRRDYEADGSYYFNVDGVHPLGDAAIYRASFERNDWLWNREDDEALGTDALTMNERIELLVNRSFVRCHKSDRNRWPYDDTYTVPISAPFF